MFRHSFRAVLLTIVLSAVDASIAVAQIEIPALHEIRLPVPTSRGSFGGGFWADSVPSNKRFAVRLAPDRRLLVVNPNVTGQWSLTRVGKWWTDQPEIESLDVPGWTAANVKREQDIETGMLVTPDGGYAAVVSRVDEVKDGEHIPFAPDHSLKGKLDTLVVLIDLKRWQVIGGFHTATLGDFDFRRVQIVGEKWVALEGYNRSPSPVMYAHVFERVNQVISIPGLTPGPSCISKESGSLAVRNYDHPDTAAIEEANLARQNNASCSELLKATGLTSLHRFESLMYLGTDPPPETYQPYKEYPRRFSTGTGPIDERNFNHRVITGRSDNRGFTAEDNYLYHYNPPFESRAGDWYEFQNQEGTRTYQLAKYDNAGTGVAVKPTTLLKRGRCGQSWCDCRVEDVREETNSLLAFCHGFTVGFLDVHHPKAQWITIFRTTDLSEIGDIQLSKDHSTKQVLATNDGLTYVLAVELGETLHIYQVPSGAPNSAVPLPPASLLVKPPNHSTR